MKTIKASIDGLGNPTLSTEGFTGQACTQATEAVERLYGGKTAYTETSEMYASEEQQTVEQGV